FHVIKSPEHLRLLLNKIDQATLISQDQQVVLERLAPHIIRNKTEFTRLVHEIVTGRPADNNLNKGNTLSWFFNGNLSNALVVDETKFLNFLTQKSHGTVDIFTDPYYTNLKTQNKGFFRPQYRREIKNGKYSNRDQKDAIFITTPQDEVSSVVIRPFGKSLLRHSTQDKDYFGYSLGDITHLVDIIKIVSTASTEHRKGLLSNELREAMEQARQRA
ncbi:hypothetical protein DID80_06885, partial [Candidatus Marinamargulisbacteria bacterium SCGC AAA071-K20]